MRPTWLIDIMRKWCICKCPPPRKTCKSHKPKKKNLFGQNFSFWAKNAKIFKNKKLIKKSEKTFPRYMYLDGFGKFLVIFVQDIFVLPLVKKKKKKKMGQKSLFWRFLKNTIFNQKSDYLNRFLVKFLSRKMYTACPNKNLTMFARRI